MSSSNRIDLAALKEATYGTTPSTGDGQPIRITSESLAYGIDYASSEEIRSDRARARGVRTAARATGDINFEMSYGQLDDLLLAIAGQTDWPSHTISGVIYSTVAGAAGVQHYLRSGGSFITDGFIAGQWIEVAGFTLAANNGFARVTAVEALKLLVEGPTLTAEAAGDTVSIKGQAIGGNGTTLTSFSIEKSFLDVTQHLLFRGMVPGSLSLTVATGAIVTGTMGFLGREVVAAAASAMARGIRTTGRVMNAVEGAAFRVAAAVEDSMTSLELNLNANPREVLEIGRLGAREISLGSIAVTGTMEQYFRTRDLYDDLIAATARNLSIHLDDEDGGWYILDLPQVDFTSGSVVAEGLDTDVLARLEWEASVSGDLPMYTLTRAGS